MVKVKLVLDASDQAGIRVRSAADPLLELQLSAHQLAAGRSADPLLHGWANRTATTLGPSGSLVMEVMTSGLVTMMTFGIHPASHPEVIGDALDLIRRVPRSVWKSGVEHLSSASISPGRPARMAEDSGQIPRFAAVLDRYHRAAVQPLWPAITAQSRFASDSAARSLAAGGADGLLNGLHPRITWSEPVLTLDIGLVACGPRCPHRQAGRHIREAMSAGPIHIRGRGLYLVPSVFAPGVCLGIPDHHSDGPFGVVYPINVDWAALIAAPDPAHGSLTALMGATRAALLDAMQGRALSTSELAATTRVSVATASEHATVLRRAGLITSTRHRNRVDHELTAIGAALLSAAH